MPILRGLTFLVKVNWSGERKVRWSNAKPLNQLLPVLQWYVFPAHISLRTCFPTWWGLNLYIKEHWYSTLRWEICKMILYKLCLRFHCVVLNLKHIYRFKSWNIEIFVRNLALLVTSQLSVALLKFNFQFSNHDDWKSVSNHCCINNKLLDGYERS